MPETFDILVIGAGPGGHAAAVRVARLGARASTSANPKSKKIFYRRRLQK